MRSVFCNKIYVVIERKLQVHLIKTGSIGDDVRISRGKKWGKQKHRENSQTSPVIGKSGDTSE